MDNDLNQPYCIMSSYGYVIEKSDNFNNSINGQISDIVQKSKKILAKDNIDTIQIFFENKSILIKDNIANDLNISTIINNEKK